MIERFPMVLPDILDNASQNYPNHGVGFVYSDSASQLLTFPELRQKALSILAGLQEMGLVKGSKAILSIEKSEELIPALWACFYGGIIPALLQPPVSFSEYNPAAEKAAKVASLLNNPWVIFSNEHAFSWHTCNIPHNRLIDISDIHGEANAAASVQSNQNDLALIQFSSGSTGDPKGVMLTHKNIIANTSDIIKGINLKSHDISVNWMPLYHDMGLLGFHITPVFAGVIQYFINPVDFIKNPSLWLETMSRNRCTITACPNFGQALVNRHLTRKSAYDWDLSPLRIIFNGAEPISVTTMLNFIDKLKPYRFNQLAMFPAYGLAEATLAVTFPNSSIATEIRTFERETLLHDGIAAEIFSYDEQSVELINLGTHLEHCEVFIADDLNQPLTECHVGNVLVRGQNVTDGYFADPEKTSASFAGEWLLTGDLGFIYEGNLYITGRSKDLIFINGTNFYAHDLETIALKVEGINYGKIVIAGSFDEDDGRDKLLIFLVGAKNDETIELCLRLKNHFANMVGLVTETFIAVKSSDIPRTSSGKLQRYKMVERYLKGDFGKVIQI
ncbi:MAG: AMP-binding protein [Bacteroidota bacterium]